MACKFTLPYAGLHCTVSPNGSFVAFVTTGNRLTVRSIDTLEVTNIFQCVDKIEKVEISPDSEFILCALYSRNVVQVFSMNDKDWKCRINEGVPGIINAFWTPDSKKVVTESDFGIQLSLWSLTDSISVIVSLPKPTSTHFSKSTAFSDCGRFLAVVHRIELHDQIGVYYIEPQTSSEMSEVSKFRAKSSDVSAVYWVPGGTHIVTMDSPLSFKFCAYTPSGECVTQHEAYQHALGLRCLSIPKPPSWAITAGSPCVESKFLALGSFDGKVRLVSMLSWDVAFVLPLVHPKELGYEFTASHALLITVECAATRGVQSSESDHGDIEQQDDNEETEEADSTHTPTGQEVYVIKQKQVPRGQQHLRSLLYRPPRGIVGLNESAGEYENEEDILPSEVDHSKKSYFALRNVKTLPRAQGFILDTKRVLSGTAAKSTKKVGSTTTVGATSAATSGSGGSGFPIMGVSWVGWSKSCSLLAAREEAHPRCVWIWRSMVAELEAMLVMLEPVTCCKWRPQPEGVENSLPTPPPPPSNAHHTSSRDHDMLALCTGTERVYFWTAATGVRFADMGDVAAFSHGDMSGRHFAVTSLRWTKNGTELVLRGKEAYNVCHVDFSAVLLNSHA